ncbi:Ubiquitin-conjugating enzyme [Penicillium waksmanii]|uniref:Ubiquitin-conjugating enzyme n=1 Tax=Penicillium waksmanii TaxID=69791 RepID=UPI00254911D4|nr:Ubiquitin-conjugating enzyme [Penicillium waksmanii]KAJ5980821.1 Ubiquitin-conjugating enzyme [Penicillium waksmanii]
MTSPSTRRLLKESTDLHKNPSPYFTASPVDDTNLHDWHFTLVGPPSPTPYAKGLYHGRITFPAAYPLRPPSFRFLTPSARFEKPGNRHGGVRTALLAIRSEIFSGESKGQVGGMEGSEELRREYAGLSRGEVGVKVDVEGFEGGDGDGDGEGQDEEKDGQEGETDPPQGRHDLHDSSAAPMPRSVPVSAPEPEISTPTDPVTSPRPPVSDPASQSVQRSTSVSTPRTIPAVPNSPSASTQLDTRPQPALAPFSPANSPWIDRAIICVVVALVILVLRRTIDVDDL